MPLVGLPAVEVTDTREVMPLLHQFEKNTIALSDQLPRMQFYHLTRVNLHSVIIRWKIFLAQTPIGARLRLV